MSQSGAPISGERWNVNMPAIIGVVFVFLCAVVVWVIASSGDDDPGQIGAAESLPPTVATTSTTVPGSGDITGTTTPAPMPSTSVASPAATVPPTTAAPPTAAPTTAPPTAPPATPAPTAPPETAPATAAPDAGPDAVPGDLGISGRPMRSPSCNGDYITILASAIGDQATAAGVDAVLGTYSGAEYLRTDQTCPSLRQSASGQPIYVVYFGPFSDDDEACDARSTGPDDAYVRRLSTDLGPDHSITCP